MTASYKREGRAGGCGAVGWAIRLEAFLLSMFFRRIILCYSISQCETILILICRLIPTKQVCKRYSIAGNIGGEFNLADWRICESTAKLNSAKRHAVLLVPRHMVSDRQIKFPQTAKIANPPNISPTNFSGYTVLRLQVWISVFASISTLCM